MRFFLAPLLFILGILIMKYTVAITNQTGQIDYAEKYLGGGFGAGTYTFWRLFGLGLCILSLLWLFNKLPSGPASSPTAPSSYVRHWMA